MSAEPVAFNGGRGFASDNASGLLPEVAAALVSRAHGHETSYGGDACSRRVEGLFREHFGPCASFLVFNGTAANVLGLKAVLDSHESVICADSSHLYADECGALEFVTGSRLVPVRAVDGKLHPDQLTTVLGRCGDKHAPQPRVVSITQPTELGTVYALDELQALADFAHRHGLLLHVDGARLVNAAAALECSLQDLTRGADLLSFGGTKHGLMCAEAVIFFDAEHAKNFEYVRKQGLQLASKTRFLAVQFEAWLTDELWFKNAKHANRLARKLADALSGLPALSIPYPVDANAVFARLPGEAIEALQSRVPFHVWSRARSEVRWMMNFDTTDEDVDRFAALVRSVLTAETSPSGEPHGARGILD